MLGVCSGLTGKKSELHCDSSKATFNSSSGLPINFNPLNQFHINTLEYNATGRISSTNSQMDAEIDNILNLNIEFLKRLRKKNGRVYSNTPQTMVFSIKINSGVYC